MEVVTDLSTGPVAVTGTLPSMAPPANATLAQVISRIESANDPHAFRFEPALYSRLNSAFLLGSLTSVQQEILQRIIKLHECSHATAMIIYCSSFGLFQIMGENLYADQMGEYKTMVDYFNNIVFQQRCFATFINWRGLNIGAQTLADSAAARSDWAIKYNGANSYALLIAESLKALGYDVKNTAA